MTLDEAIEMSERIGSGDSERAANNRWLAEQLRLLKFVEETHVIDEAARARREMHEWQLMWKRAEAENAKLRELVRKYGEYTDQDRCEGCVCKSRCNDGDIDECWQLTEIRELARELGIEVEE